MADRPEMFIVWAYQGVFGDSRFNETIKNVAGPTLVVMATTIGLGAEIQSPTGLSTVNCLCVKLSLCLGFKGI